MNKRLRKKLGFPWKQKHNVMLTTVRLSRKKHHNLEWYTLRHSLLPRWHFIGMLPGMLIAPWIAQHTGSTGASFAAHAIGNSPLWIILLIGILNSPLDKEKNSAETSV